MKLEDEGMELTHFNPEGRAQMVDVSGKEATFRVARAAATVRMAAATAEKIRAGQIGKGDVLQWRRWQASWLPRRTAS